MYSCHGDDTDDDAGRGGHVVVKKKKTWTFLACEIDLLLSNKIDTGCYAAKDSKIHLELLLTEYL